MFQVAAAEPVPSRQLPVNRPDWGDVKTLDGKFPPPRTVVVDLATPARGDRRGDGTDGRGQPQWGLQEDADVAAVPAHAGFDEADVRLLPRRLCAHPNRIYVFFVLGFGSRSVHVLGTTTNPDRGWITRQIRNLPAGATAKAAIRSFARGLAVELGDRGIRVNAISPGYIRTRPGQADAAAFQAAGAAGIPLRRVGRPEEVAAATLFLASGDSSYITGSELFVDGGRTQV
ncbi:SDR family oxidoreductase [Amycolatopsis sp. NPDC024027]|uniref:SDR family oxidoreductase n=1 Tax=Amycolatopsis sp. NPDC024027 TaxID=3154327 RepID=UPI00340DEDB7